MLNLAHILYVAEVRSEIYVLMKNLVDSGRLKYYDDAFWKVKLDGTEEEIKNFRAWLRRVTFNDVKKRRYQENKHNKLLNIDDYSHDHSQENLWSNLEKKELIEKIKVLDTVNRIILELYFFEGLSFKEISQCLRSQGLGEYTETNLHQKKRRALDKLRELF